MQRINELRDKLAATQLDMDRRDSEIDQLNEELDGKVREHDREIAQVEAEWRDEVMEARGQVDELKDVSDLFVGKRRLIDVTGSRGERAGHQGIARGSCRKGRAIIGHQ
jgi:chromosome segregation ATPase